MIIRSFKHRFDFAQMTDTPSTRRSIVGISVLSLSTQVQCQFSKSFVNHWWFMTGSSAPQIFQTRRQQTTLRDRVQDYDTVEIMKDDGTTHEVPSETLVPGDIILIPKHGAKVVCDSVLLSGNCIVNESSLTGTVGITLHFRNCLLKTRS